LALLGSLQYWDIVGMVYAIVLNSKEFAIVLNSKELWNVGMVYAIVLNSKEL